MVLIALRHGLRARPLETDSHHLGTKKDEKPLAVSRRGL